MTEELEELKNRLIEEYRANGGKRDVSAFSATMIMNEIDHLKEKKKLEEEIKALRENNTPPAHDPIRPIQAFGRINAAERNKELVREAAEVLGGYIDYLDPPFDDRALDDERYLRDNAVAKLCKPGEEDTVVILRDRDGRMA